MTKSKRKRQRDAMGTAGDDDMSPRGTTPSVAVASAVSSAQSSSPLLQQTKTTPPNKNTTTNQYHIPMSIRSEDSSTWSKSKRKRMRKKEAKRLFMATEESPSHSIQFGNDNANHHHRKETPSTGIKPLPISHARDTIHINQEKKHSSFSDNTNPSLGFHIDQYSCSPTKKDTKDETLQSQKLMSSTSDIHLETSPKKKKKKKKKKKVEDAMNNNSHATPRSKVEEMKVNIHEDTSRDSFDRTSNNDVSSCAHSNNNRACGTTSTNNANTPHSPASPNKVQISLPKPSHMSTLQKAFLERLTSSRFRELNEELYTHSSQHSYEQFTKNPELFDQYHVGFRKQVQEWPVNPVDIIYKKIKNSWSRQKDTDIIIVGGEDVNRKPRLNGSVEDGVRGKKIQIADFGCGDAKLAKRLLALRIGKDGQSLVEFSGMKSSKEVYSSLSSSCPFQVHSFDLVSGGNPLVTPADMSNVPLSNEAVDVVVCCLALMGTNVADFIREAWRVLKFNGVLRVAEVRSRFETATSVNHDQESRNVLNGNGEKRGKLNNGKKHTITSNNKNNNAHHSPRKNIPDGENSLHTPLMLLDEFLSLLERCGFQCTNMDRSNKMFLFMDLIKVKGSKGLSDNVSFSAKPCIYKRR